MISDFAWLSRWFEFDIVLLAGLIVDALLFDILGLCAAGLLDLVVTMTAG
jgi:hypothetical protein